MWVLGMDLGRKGAHRVVLMEGPEPTKRLERRVRSSAEELEALYEQVTKWAGKQDVEVVMEASGMAWLIPAQQFRRFGWRVVRVQAERAKDFRKYLRKHAKTDSIDAESLARLRFVEPDSLDEIHLRDARRFALKQTLKQREQHVEETTRYTQRLIDLIDGYIPSLSGLSNRLVGKKKFRPMLPKLFDWTWMGQMGPSRFTRYVQRRDGDIDEATGRRIFEAGQEARALHDPRLVDESTLVEQASHYTQMLQINETKKDELTAKLTALYEQLPGKAPLESIPGVGTLTAAYGEAYLSPIERFANLKKLNSYCGIIPKTAESATVRKKGLKMSKAGPAPLRRQLYLAADVARRYDPQIAQVYHREMTEKGNPHTQAVVACMRRVLARIARVLRDKRPYELRDTRQKPVDSPRARELAQKRWKVPEEVRRRLKQKRPADGAVKGSPLRELLSGQSADQHYSTTEKKKVEMT